MEKTVTTHDATHNDCQAGKRDLLLDAMRAYAMIYIVCVVHLFYCWLWPSSTLVSLLLFEMPAIFFIAGASARHSQSHSFWQLLVGRLRRVVLPYYVYAAISLVVLFATGLAAEPFVMREMLMVLIGDEIPGLPYAWHLWFILPYLVVSVSFHFQRRWAERYGIGYLLLVAAIACLACSAFSLSGTDLHQMAGLRRIVCHNLLYVLCYNVFFVAGFVLYRRFTVARTMAVLLIAVVLAAVLAVSSGEAGCLKGWVVAIPDMQVEKFPPTIVFMLFGTAALCLLSLVIRRTGLPYPSIVAFWNRHGYTIYLYQNYCLWLFVAAFSEALLSTLPLWLVIPVGMASLFVLNTVFAYCLSFIVPSLRKVVSGRCRPHYRQDGEPR